MLKSPNHPPRVLVVLLNSIRLLILCHGNESQNNRPFINNESESWGELKKKLGHPFFSIDHVKIEIKMDIFFLLFKLGLHYYFELQ